MFEHYIFGKFANSEKPLSQGDIDSILLQADKVSGKIQDMPMDKIIDVLDAVSTNWLNDNYRLRQIALKKMPAIAGYSSEMTRLAIDTLFNNMKRENLLKIMRTHIGRAAYLDRFEYLPTYEGYIKAQPLGIILHVSPGNVFVGGADSLMYGLLSKNVNILKLSRQDPLFPFLFAESLKEVDGGEFLANSFCILNFSGKDKDIEKKLKDRCDGIVVIGGEEAVQNYRQDLRLGTRLVEYGPKYSFSVITAEAYEKADPDQMFFNCAKDITIWEQKACSSPQVIFVEKNVAKDFVDNLQYYLDKINEKYPQQNLSLDEKIEILKVREMARFEQMEGTADLYQPSRSCRWTIIYEESTEIRTTSNRVIYVKPFTSWGDILGQAVKIKDYLQSVGVLATPNQIKTLSKALACVGVSRICPLGKMTMGKPWSPHDFDFPLRKLVKWITVEGFEERFDLGEHVAPPKLVSKWDRMKNLLRFARDNSAFYKKHLEGIPLKSITSAESYINTIPLLNKEHIYHNTPPESDAILTAHLKQAYVFASGGSVGEPKFSFYSYRELGEVATMLSDIYQIAGIKSEDVVANLFMAGFLWTSFIVVNHALEKIGCVSLPIAGNADIDLMLRYMNLFRPNAIVGLPSMIIQLAEEIQNRKLDLRFEKILYGGEHFSDEAVKFLKETVGAQLVHSAGYASVDAGPIGYQCPHTTGGIHHLLYEYVFLEFVDPDTGKPMPKGEVGEIVVTNLHRHLMPIIRYKTGDLGRWLDYECPCGQHTPLFELLGRCDDILRIGAMSIYPSRISEIIATVEGIGPLFQMVADYEGVKEKLTLYVESQENSANREDLSQKLFAQLLQQDSELRLVVEEKWLGDLTVQVLPPGGIERNPRTGKIRRIIDRRKRT